MAIVKAYAKADTAYGPITSHTTVQTVYGGDNLVTFLLTINHTPVEFSVSGPSLRALVDQLIGHMGQMNREHALRQLAAIDAGQAS